MSNAQTLQNLVETFIQYGIRAYKKQWRNTSDGRKLDRHESVKLNNDVPVSSWRELAIHQMAEYLKDEGLCNTEVILEGNSSEITLLFDNDSELKFCITKLKQFFDENKLEV